jgi:hypothetical protein
MDVGYRPRNSLRTSKYDEAPELREVKSVILQNLGNAVRWPAQMQRGIAN